jgi:hypothetical protein
MQVCKKKKSTSIPYSVAHKHECLGFSVQNEGNIFVVNITKKPPLAWFGGLFERHKL